jgi:hypothetical protein
VDLLKRTGKVVKLKLYRYQKGLKFQQVEVSCYDERVKFAEKET